MSHQLFVRVTVASVVVMAAVALFAGPSPQAFRIRDDCDPPTFNADPPVGPGAGEICNPAFDGGTTFERFIEELMDDQKVGAWRFNPDRVDVDSGQGTSLENRGGEFHTFTRVDQFGGGIIGGLNNLSGSGPTRPECGALGNLAPPREAHIFVPDGANFAGPTAGSSALPSGTTKWQCCIHPWMRSEITVQ